VCEGKRVWDGLLDVGLGFDHVSLVWPRQSSDPAKVSSWMSMGYPMKREMKIKLIFLYYELLCEFQYLRG
jgi:hypothetical protein